MFIMLWDFINLTKLFQGKRTVKQLNHVKPFQRVIIWNSNKDMFLAVIIRNHSHATYTRRFIHIIFTRTQTATKHTIEILLKVNIATIYPLSISMNLQIEDKRQITAKLCNCKKKCCDRERNHSSTGIAEKFSCPFFLEY